MAGVSASLIAGLAVLGIGLLLHVVGMATPDWTTSGPYSSMGPFRLCSGDACIATPTGNSKIDAVKAMTVIGALLGSVGLCAAIILFVFAIKEKDIHAMVPKAIVAASIGAFIFILLGVIIWGAAVHYSAADIGYSFGLSIAGGVLTAIGGILVFTASK